MKNFAFGFSTFFGGLRLWARTPALLKLSIIPFLVDFVFFVGGLIFAMAQIPTLLAHIVSQPEFWYQYVWYYFVMIVTALSLFLIVIFIVFVAANLLLFPFNDILADRVLEIHHALPHREKGLKSWWQKTKRNSSAMAKKTIILLVVAGFLALATLVPGLGFFAALIGVFIMAFDRLDYSFDHYQWTFKQRVSFMKSNLGAVLGFATGLGLTTAIPMINILAMPGSVVAGASLVAHLSQRTNLERSHS